MNVKGLVPLAALALATGLGLPSLAQDNAADSQEPANAMTKSAPAAAPAAVGKPDTHNGAWLETHGQAARVDEESCLQCHTGRTSCIQCHQDTQPRSHTPSWVKRGHALEARWSRETCLACHNDDSCIACHQSTPPSSHRPGWGTAVTGVPGGEHCASCHYPLSDTTCFTCHKVAHTQGAYPTSAIQSPAFRRH